VLIARGSHLERIHQAGLRLRTPSEDVVLDIPAVAHPRDLQFTGDEIVMLTMKSQHTGAALDDLRLAAGDDAVVVCAQNGVDNERMAARRFRQVYGMLVVVPATFLEPGVVLLNAHPLAGVLDTGRFPRGVDGTAVQICRDLTASGFVAEPQAAVMEFKYAKLLRNLGNSVHALCGPEANSSELARDLREEAERCFRVAGTRFASPERFQKRIAHLQYGAVGGEERGGSSSWQSLVRGTGSIEADFLNGEIALLGVLHGIPTPLNRAVQTLAARAAVERHAPGQTSVEEILRVAAQDAQS
jgi:2-dehydropantoate 2-reductase